MWFRVDCWCWGSTFRVCYSCEVEGGGFKKGGDGVGNRSDLFLVYVCILLRKCLRDRFKTYEEVFGIIFQDLVVFWKYLAVQLSADNFNDFVKLNDLRR